MHLSVIYPLCLQSEAHDIYTHLVQMGLEDHGGWQRMRNNDEYEEMVGMTEGDSD